MTGNTATVLVVEDERDLADLYAAWLNEHYDTDVVYDGAEAQDRLQHECYDVVLLDRRMPNVSGDNVLDTIQEQDVDCHVAMVTAMDPDFDILEMRFDSYVVKPVTADDLYDVVDRLLNLTRYERQVQRLYGLVDKRAVLEGEKTAGELAASEEYAALNEEITRLQAESRDSLSAIDDSDMAKLMQSLTPRGPGRTDQ